MGLRQEISLLTHELNLSVHIHHILNHLVVQFSSPPLTFLPFPFIISLLQLFFLLPISLLQLFFLLLISPLLPFVASLLLQLFLKLLI